MVIPFGTWYLLARHLCCSLQCGLWSGFAIAPVFQIFLCWSTLFLSPLPRALVHVHGGEKSSKHISTVFFKKLCLLYRRQIDFGINLNDLENLKTLIMPGKICSLGRVTYCPSSWFHHQKIGLSSAPSFSREGCGRVALVNVDWLLIEITLILVFTWCFVEHCSLEVPQWHPCQGARGWAHKTVFHIFL